MIKENIKKVKKITLFLKKSLYLKIEEEARQKDPSNSQFVNRIISAYFGIEYFNSNKKPSNTRQTDLTNKGEILPLTLTLNEALHLRIKKEAEKEKLSMPQLINKIIMKHFGIENSEAESGQSQESRPMWKTTGKLLKLYLGVELHILLQKEAIKRKLSKFEFIHQILIEYLGVEYSDIAARDKYYTELISEDKQISLHLSVKMYNHLEDKAKKEGRKLKVSQLVRKVIEEYLGAEKLDIKSVRDRQYNKSHDSIMVFATFTGLYCKFIEEGAEKENISMPQFVRNAIENYLSMECLNVEKSFSDSPNFNTKTIETIDKLKNKLKNINISLDKHIYLLLEEKVKKENITRMEFIRRAIIEYLSAKYPDMKKSFYNNTIRNYRRRSIKKLKDYLFYYPNILYKVERR
jgi:metal-responsive CopG/Arc/MetJ family transcriptional regulator